LAGSKENLKVGFESAYAARRRLAVLATSDEGPDGAFAPSLFAGYEAETAVEGVHSAPQVQADVVHHLDELAQDIVATPGAGGALLVAFAAQARALSMVLEVALRTTGSPGLPAEVVSAVQAALRVPPSVSGLELAWRR
jgi:hypothetical protein